MHMLISSPHNLNLCSGSQETCFLKNVFEAVHETRSTCFIGSKTTRLRLVVLNPIKHSCSFFKHYLNHWLVQHWSTWTTAKRGSRHYLGNSFPSLTSLFCLIMHLLFSQNNRSNTEGPNYGVLRHAILEKTLREHTFHQILCTHNTLGTYTEINDVGLHRVICQWKSWSLTHFLTRFRLKNALWIWPILRKRSHKLAHFALLAQG